MPNRQGPDQARGPSAPLHDRTSGPASNSKKGASAAETPPSGVEPPTWADTSPPEAPPLIESASPHELPTAIEAPTAVESVPSSGRGTSGSSERPPSSWGGVPLQPGKILGNRYEIIQILGEGGMGAVYKALDREVGRTIALKVIRPELANNAEILQRFGAASQTKGPSPAISR